ncbi:MAG TPA: DUF4382 domain-containing protein [Nitrospiraceae bacterium]|nr:DUF4382 domain-containing protein [Nitrospiraceae bacterium]
MGFLLTVFIAGCGSDGGGSTQPGTVGVSMTDAPACGYDEVNVTVSKVRVHQSGSADDKAAGWTDITLDPPRTINLLNLNDPTKLNFALESLGETSLGAGHYTQLRLVLEDNNGNQPSANWIVLTGQNPTNKIPLETPSAIRSGVKLIHQFTVNSGQRVDLLLDFDACKSIVRTGSGKYILKPVIKVIPFALNGIEGFVDKQSFVNQSLLGKNIMASAQFNGEIVRATVVNTDTGKFFLAHLDPGNDYDVVITADDHATAVIVGVPVSPAPSITTISTSVAPFPLQTSTFQAIDGTVTLKPDDPANDDGTVIVSAKQTLNSGPTVTVKSQVATVKTDTQATIGDYGYALTLPIGAPSRGLYGALPITLSATVPDQSAVAKMYTVKGSGQVGTTVFATQAPLPSSVDITVVSTQDFTLTQ